MSDPWVLAENCEAQVKRLHFKLESAETALEKALIARAPYKVGDVVFAKGREVIVRKVVPRPSALGVRYARWDYNVSYRRRNGEWKDLVQHCYHMPTPCDDWDAGVRL